MDPIQQRIASLTPERRALLEQRLMTAAAGTAQERIPRRAGHTPRPLSFAQERLWFLDQLLPGGGAYNTSHAVRIRGALDVEVLRRALDATVTRHEALRTVFVEKDGVPLQAIVDHVPASLPVLDLRQQPDGEREAVMRQHLEAEIGQSFDLARGPLWRTRLVRLGDLEHVLLLAIHHIVFDGWSLGVLWQELATNYEAFVAGQPSPLPPVPVQYADFAEWQRSRLTGELLDSELAYWTRTLAGAPALLALPADHPRPAVWTGRGRQHFLEIPGELVDRLTKLSRQERATLFMTLLAAFQTLLLRYTGQSDIVVGTALAGRTRTELEGLIGLFARTLAMRTDLSGDPTFSQLLARVREVTLGAYAHQELPFERLVEDLAPERSVSHAPIFQTMFLLQNAQRSLTLPGLEVTRLATDNGAAQVDLTLSLGTGPQGLRGRIEYSTDLFDAGTIARMVRHYETLLRGIVAAPDQPLSALPLLPTEERQRMLVEWNATAAEFPREACVHQLIEAQAQRTPDAVAVVCDGRRLTYRELDAQATRLAGRLRAEGVGPDTLVGLCVDRSLEMVVGLIGILKAGGAYVPLDPAHPLDRLTYVLGDARVRVLVTEEQRRAEFERAVPRIITFAEGEGTAAAREPEAPTGTVTPEHLAYVMYTSGSTGRPKGVAVAHRSVVNVLDAMRRAPGLTAEDVFLAVTTLAFDIATLELLLPLSVGARLEVVTRDVATDGTALAARQVASGATAMQATPATWRLLIEAGWPGSPGFKILCGGEALRPDLASELGKRGASLWNLYGPTEATIWCTVHPVSAGDDPVLIGRPIQNVECHILDGRLEPTPIGVPGELYVGGVALARGYLNRPELTAERFVANPFSIDPAARLYRTGDLARYRADGTIEYMGRLDHQVKLRGFRVEPGEIEAALAAHPDVASAVVVLRESSAENARLVAYLTPSDGGHPDTWRLQEFLRRQLPDYMVPTAFVVMERFPLTPNGKLDRTALPNPDLVERPDADAFVAPRTPMEALLAEVWQTLLGVERVSVRDNFFDLGGHSLLAMRAIARVEARTGCRLKPGDLIFQTLEQVAQLCGQVPAAPTAPPRPGVLDRVRRAVRRALSRA